MATSSTAATSALGTTASWRTRSTPFLSYLLLLVLTTRNAVLGFPSGAGQCLVGQVSVGSPHLPQTVGDGTLSFFGLQVLVDGTVLDSTKPFQLTKGKPHKVEIKAAANKPFKGFLLVASSPTGSVDFSGAWTPDDATNGQVAAVCAAPLGGVTHKNADLKTSASGTLVVDVDTAIKLDVTVVMERSSSASGFGWAQYSGSVVAAAAAPTKAPTKAPTSPLKPPTKAPTAPVKPPTKAPTAPVKAPTKAPTSPVKAPTKAPASPVKAPTKAPTSPVKAPTKAPTSPVKAPTKVPTSPVQGPTKAPTRSPTQAPTVPRDNRGDGNGDTKKIRGWEACFRKVQRECECRRRSTFRCARRTARRQCQRGRNRTFVKAVKEHFGEYCRRTRNRNRNRNSNGDSDGDGW